MEKPSIIDVRRLFPELYSELILVLERLSSEEWNYSTSSSKWNVKDITAHLLDGDLRRLSFQRDGLIPQTPKNEIKNYNELVEYLNYLNNSWIEVSKRLSPRIIIDLLRYSGEEIPKLFNSLDLHDKALFGVNWAGEEESQNWFDIAREYTEKWYHQQQIREAVGESLLSEEKWTYPLIDTFIRGLPNTFQNLVSDKINSIVYIEIEDIPKARWYLLKDEHWKLYVGEPSNFTSKVVLNSDTAWRLFSKNISKEVAKKRISVEGDQNLGLLILELTAFIK